MDPKIRSVSPILPTHDVQATLDWYKSSLGATNDWIYGDPPDHAGFTLGASQIQLCLDPEYVETALGVELFTFVQNIRALRDDFVARGVKIAEDLELKPWGATEFVVIDPNGIRIRLAQFGDKPDRKTALEGVSYTRRHLTAEEHRALYESVGWGGFYSEELSAEKRAAIPLVTVVAEHGGKAIGAASITGNGLETFILRDVMVVPEHQGKGIGRGVMLEVMKWIEQNVPKGANVILQTGGSAPYFYEEFGFVNADKGLAAMYYSR